MFKYCDLLVLCLLCATLACAFDWSDKDFNLILQDDILDNDELDLTDDDDLQSEHLRFARAVDTNPPRPSLNKDCVSRRGGRNAVGSNRIQRSCCGEKDDLKMHGEPLKKLRKECAMEVRKLRMNKLNGEEEEPLDLFNCDSTKRIREDVTCVMECVAKKKNMADDDGNLLPDEVTSFIKNELVTEDWQKNIINGVIEKCLQQNVTSLNTEKKKYEENSNPHDILAMCNPASLKFSHCLWREMQLSCPKDMIKNTTECQRMRQRLEKQESPNFPKKGRPGIVNRRQKNETKKDD